MEMGGVPPRRPTRFAEQVTPGGHRSDEAASALQKAIRRGEERNALYWASELDLAGYANYVWKRLRIIASEDVGLADPLAAVQVRSLYENWRDAIKDARARSGEHGPHRLFLVHAVLVLARAPKSRIVDHATMIQYRGQRPALEVPDHALDRHTARGRSLGRGREHFFDEGARLENAAPLDDPYAAEARALRPDGSR
jgi:replication-associated recombination protein RarA